MRLAAAAGFIVVDLSDVYKGEDLEAIRLAEWDEHPNARGHQLIAEPALRRAAARSAMLVFKTAAR